MLFHWGCLIVSISSVILNGLLVYAFVCISSKALGYYKFYILAFIISGLAYSLIFLTHLPAVIIIEGTMGLLPSTPFYFGNFHLVQLYVALCAFIVLLFVCCFLYRYSILCVDRPLHRKLLLGVKIFLIVELMVADQVFIMLAFRPNSDVYTTILEEARRFYNIDLTGKELMAVNMSKDETGMMVYLLYNILAEAVVTICIVIFCSHRIVGKIKTAVISENTRRLNKQMFQLLICQSTIPVFFLYWPYVTYTFCMILGKSMDDHLISLNNFFNSLFPLFNSIVLLVFMRKYRQFILKKFSLKRIVHLNVVSSPRVTHVT